eukprot:TRINITY_DN19068_c0_g1_i2.p1 TRINITY_DN19068_c0_g1~~TRINITY_DN19068_c0_g1_i2.p1  ORF type:complete len:101 (-),score=11.81 TRINITY_DN19068_c0_g1_i2:90-392(-)
MVYFAQVRWSCAFTYVSFGLALAYVTFFCIISVYLYYLLKDQVWSLRQAQKLFLFLSLATCFGRTVYFSAWPDLAATGSACDPSTEETSDFLNVVGDLPA